MYSFRCLRTAVKIRKRIFRILRTTGWFLRNEGDNYASIIISEYLKGQNDIWDAIISLNSIISESSPILEGSTSFLKGIPSSFSFVVFNFAKYYLAYYWLTCPAFISKFMLPTNSTAFTR